MVEQTTKQPCKTSGLGNYYCVATHAEVGLQPHTVSETQYLSPLNITPHYSIIIYIMAWLKFMKAVAMQHRECQT